MKDNPFSLSFGTEPNQYISRRVYITNIVETFLSEKPSNFVYMISGVRGSGKTVLLSTICGEFHDREDWIVIDVIPDADILNSIAAKLYSIKRLKKLFVKAKLDFSAFGLGISIEEGNQIFDIETAIEQMLSELKKNNIKVLIAIDEIVNNTFVKTFTATFQLLIRKKLPVFLVMTGLYDNIYNLQNEKSLTFLYRAPKIMLEPLNLGAISRSYSTILNLDAENADEMAKLTMGYPFAYQVLGYLYWNEFIVRDRKGNLDELLPDYDELLGEYVYEKIWSELSPKERDIVSVISEKGEIKVSDIREILDIPSNSMSVYRDRLKRKGVINSSKYGWMSYLSKKHFFVDK